METMLWFCGTDAPVADRVSRAAEYYQSKYQRVPTFCLLSKTEPEIPGSVGGISCSTDGKVDTGHLMMGVA